MLVRRTYPFFVVAPCCVAVLFTLKAVFTGVWVIRPWDVPDEVGHFSYIKDLATGKGLPVLHETLIDEEAWRSFVPHVPSEAGENWIAQHPPLYHLLMVPVYWVGALFGNSFWGSFYCIRIATAVLFGLGIGILMNVFQKSGYSAGVTLGLGLLLASIPNHTYLAAAVNHDALVFLAGSLLLCFWVRWIRSPSVGNLLYLGLCLGMGGLVKYTFLLLIPPILLLSLLRINSISSHRVQSALIFVGSALFPIGIWMMRNLSVYGKLLPVDTTGFQSESPLQISFLQFGQEFPIFSILIQTYWGLLGWMGDGTLQVRWLQMYTVYQLAFILPVMVVLALSFFFLVKEAAHERKRMLSGALGALLFLVITYLSGWLKGEYSHYLPVLWLMPAISGWILGEFFCLLVVREVVIKHEIEFGCLLIGAFFLSVYLMRIYSFSVSSGVLQGTFGRYFLPVIGFFILGFFSPGLKKFTFAPHLVLASGFVYACVELYVWLHEAIPFFKVHG